MANLKTYFFHWLDLSDIFIKKVVRCADNGSRNAFIASKSVDADFPRDGFSFVVEHEKVYPGCVPFHGIWIIAGVCLEFVDERSRHVVYLDFGAAVGVDEL